MKAFQKMLIACGIGAMLVAAVGAVRQQVEQPELMVGFTGDLFPVEATALPGETMIAADGVISELGEQAVGERVNLPDAEGKPWLTFLYDSNWKSDPETVRFHSMWERDRRLVDLRNRCRVNTFNKMTETDRLTWSKFAGKDTPAVVLQLPDGQLVSKISRANMPSNSNDLYAMIKRDCDDCFRRPKPDTPVAPVEPAVNPLPDTVLPPTDRVPESKSEDPLWILAILGFFGVIGGVALGRKKR